MNFKQCQIFRAVSRYQNFTKAAEHLFMTQSAVSHAMKDLEEEAGCQLIERLHRGIRLTSAGEKFLQEMAPIIEEFEALEAHLPRLVEQVPLKIASCLTYGQSELPQLLSRLLVHETRAEVFVAPASEVLTRFERGKADIAFLEGTVSADNFQQKIVSQYSIGFYAAPKIAESLSSTLTIGEAVRQPLLVRERGSAVRETLEAALVLKNQLLHPTWESTDSEALIAAAVAGLGLAVLPDVLVEEVLEAGSLVEVKLVDFTLSNQVTALIRKNAQNPKLLEMWELL